MENEPQEQTNNSRPWLFKKGQSGNPGGRPKGSKSLKTRAKEYLEGLSDEEVLEYFEGLNKLDVWRMAEGNPESKTEIAATVEQINVNDEQFNRIIRARAEKLNSPESSTGGTD